MPYLPFTFQIWNQLTSKIVIFIIIKTMKKSIWICLKILSLEEDWIFIKEEIITDTEGHNKVANYDIVLYE